MRKPVLAICKQQRCRSACAGLINTFVVCYLDNIIPILAIVEISRLLLVPVAEQAGLSLTWSETPKTGFFMTWLRF